MGTRTLADITTAAAGDINSFAATVHSDPTGTPRALMLLSAATPPTVRTLLRNDPTVAKQYYVIFQGKATIITRPTIATDANNHAIYLASMGDQLDFPKPISIPVTDFEGYVITLTDRRDATTYGLPSSSDNPVTLEGPPDPNGDRTAPGLQRIHWDPVTDINDNPTVVGIPMACPVLPNQPIHDGRALTQDFTLDETQTSPLFAMWFQGMAYLLNHNASSSIHAAENLFVWNEIESSALTVYHLCDNINASIAGLNAISPHSQHVTNIFKQEKTAAFYRYASNNTIAPQGNAPATSDITQVLEALVKSNTGTTHTTTSNEREQMKEAVEVEHRYKLMFARVQDVVDPDDPMRRTRQVVYPTLTAAFKEVLNATRSTKATSLFQDHIGNQIRTMANSDRFLDTAHDMPTNMIDSVFSACIRSASWAKDPPVIEPESVKDRLGIYHFASPRTDTVTYQTRIAAGRTTLRQEQVGEDKSKVNRRASDLYCQGRMDSVSHITTMIANFWVFCVFAIEDFAGNPPLIWKGFREFLTKLQSPQGKNWTNKHAPCKHVFYHMVSDLQNILCPFINISNHFAYRDQVKNNIPIAPQAYDDAYNHAHYQVMRLNNILVSADLGDYRDVPPIMQLLAPPDSDGTTPKPTPTKSHPPRATATKAS
jgi:hypothetical protein